MNFVVGLFHELCTHSKYRYFRTSSPLHSLFLLLHTSFESTSRVESSGMTFFDTFSLLKTEKSGVKFCVFFIFMATQELRSLRADMQNRAEDDVTRKSLKQKQEETPPENEDRREQPTSRSILSYLFPTVSMKIFRLPSARTGKT